MSYVYLIGAIISEVIGTMLLPVSENFTKPIISVVLIMAYMLSFYLLTFALKDIPIAITILHINVTNIQIRWKLHQIKQSFKHGTKKIV